MTCRFIPCLATTQGDTPYLRPFNQLGTQRFLRKARRKVWALRG
jgi:hypothetical protein